MPLYVIGHKNPDTDAICSAIGYADLLRRTGTPEAEAAACGPINARTTHVLKRAALEAPKLILDIRPTAGQVCRRDVLSAHLHEPFLDVYRRMMKHKLRAIPVLDENGQLAGILPLMRLMQLILPDQQDLADQRNVDSSLSQIRSVLEGTFQHAVDPDREGVVTLMIAAMSVDTSTERLSQFAPDKLLLLLGNRPTIINNAIEYGARLIALTGGYQMPADMLERAKAKGISVLTTPHDTAMSALLIKGARSIAPAVEKLFMSFPESAKLVDVRSQVDEVRQDLFPVMDDEGRMVGIFTKSDLVSPKPVELILVDHNEFDQAVKGADEARILEVIDHHRIGGGLVTREPIRFINDTVGSTSTMIARMFRQHAIAPAPGIALCLAAGLISDTLNLQSPTTTAVDREMLAWLGNYARCNMADFAKELFSMGSTLASAPPNKVIESDCKEYAENGWKISVSQVEDLDLNRFWERKEELSTALAAHVKNRGLDFCCLLVTDITRQNSLLLTAGNEQLNDAMSYPQLERHLYELAGVVSRKKQLLPVLMQVLGKTKRRGE
jgi:manganese-dependent inorganic pyrophosphatase